jgi:acyl carrier protein
MATAERIVQREIEAVLSQRRDKDIAISPSSLLRDELGLTSLNMIEILTNVCECAKIELTSLSDVDLSRLKRVSDIISLVERREISRV